MSFAKAIAHKKIGIGLLALLGTLPLLYAQKGEQRGGEGSREGGSARESGSSRMSEPMRAPVQQRAAPEGRVSHGSLRRENTEVIKREEPVGKGFDVHRGVDVRHDYVVHRDVEADYGRTRVWSGFSYGARFRTLPFGYLSLRVGGVPYFYNDGIYYQPYEDGYQEVYPPVGAQVQQPPDGAVVVYFGDLTYYYAGGAFYVQQDGAYVIAPTQIGITVPELPPGAVQVDINGAVAYQFNGIYYQPVFVNGVTQYETITG